MGGDYHNNNIYKTNPDGTIYSDYDGPNHLISNSKNLINGPQGQRLIPAHLKNAYLNTNPIVANNIMERFLSHKNHAKGLEKRLNQYFEGMEPENQKELYKREFGRRLHTLRTHMANPDVKTVSDLLSRIYRK